MFPILTRMRPQHGGCVEVLPGADDQAPLVRPDTDCRYKTLHLINVCVCVCALTNVGLITFHGLYNNGMSHFLFPLSL